MGRGATDKSDIYSFGVVLWEVCSGGRAPADLLLATDSLAAQLVDHVESVVRLWNMSMASARWSSAPSF